MKKNKGLQLDNEEEKVLNEPREIRITPKIKNNDLLNELKPILKEVKKEPVKSNDKVIDKTKDKNKVKEIKVPQEEVKKFTTTIYGFNYPNFSNTTKHSYNHSSINPSMTNPLTSNNSNNINNPNNAIFSLYNSFHPSAKIDEFMKYCSKERTYYKDSSLNEKNYIRGCNSISIINDKKQKIVDKNEVNYTNNTQLYT